MSIAAAVVCAHVAPVLGPEQEQEQELTGAEPKELA